MAKLPSMQFYPGDWRKDPGVQALDYESRGIWFEILLLMFESKERGRLLLNGQPMPVDALSRFLGLDNQKAIKTLTKLVEYGVISKDEKGVFYSRRMIRDEEIRAIRKQSGSLGGNPSLVNQNSTTGDKQIQTPSKEEEKEELVLKKKKKERLVKTSFEESPLFNKRTFQAAFPDWPGEKCKEWYTRAVEYSGANGGRYLDWKLAIQAWERKAAVTEIPKKEKLLG